MYSIVLMMSMTSPSQAGTTQQPNYAEAIYQLDVRVTNLERRLAGTPQPVPQPAPPAVAPPAASATIAVKQKARVTIASAGGCSGGAAFTPRASCAGAAYAPMPRGIFHSRVTVSHGVTLRTGIFAERRPVRRIFGIILTPIRGRGCGG